MTRTSVPGVDRTPGHHMRVAIVLISLLAAAVVSGQDAPTDYPQWRGRTGDGSASAFVAPTTWPTELTRRWRVEIGEGYATPLIVGDTVYTFTRTNGQEVAAALDLKTGATRWRTGADVPFVPSPPAAAHGAGPKATPVFHRNALFAMGISGVVSAFDAGTGRPLWNTVDPKEVPFFSAAASPTAVGDLILAHPGNYDPLTAFDRTTGRVRWTAGAGGFFMSPVITTLDGVRQAVTVTQSGVVGVDTGSGRVLWEHKWSGGGQGGITPLVHNDLVVVSAAQSGVRAIRPVRRNGAWTADMIWDTADVSMYTSNPVVIDGVLYALASRDGGQFTALDMGTGAVLWRGPARAGKHASLVKAGALLFILSEEGELLVARPSRTALNPVARYQVADGMTWTQPTISGPHILIKGTSDLTLWTVH